jgi:hypothetical protein
MQLTPPCKNFLSTRTVLLDILVGDNASTLSLCFFFLSLFLFLKTEKETEIGEALLVRTHPHRTTSRLSTHTSPTFPPGPQSHTTLWGWGPGGKGLHLKTCKCGALLHSPQAKWLLITRDAWAPGSRYDYSLDTLGRVNSRVNSSW